MCYWLSSHDQVNQFGNFLEWLMWAVETRHMARSPWEAITWSGRSETWNAMDWKPHDFGDIRQGRLQRRYRTSPKERNVCQKANRERVESSKFSDNRHGVIIWSLPQGIQYCSYLSPQTQRRKNIGNDRSLLTSQTTPTVTVSQTRPHLPPEILLKCSGNGGVIHTWSLSKLLS